jgi:hypothetical protein
MIINKNIKFEVVATALNRRVNIEIKILNHSDNSYYIAKNALFLDGFVSKIFTISGPSKIVCRFGAFSHDKPDLLLLKSMSLLENHQELTKFCFFNAVKPGDYTIKINVCFKLFEAQAQEAIESHTDIAKPSLECANFNYNASFTIFDNNERDTLGELTYESAL